MDELVTQPLAALHRDRLTALPEGIKRPNYTRSDLRPGIVHIGVGNFHRAHQAWYLHRLMQQDEARDWAIIGAGVRSSDAAMRDKLAAQDHLTTLIELRPDGRSAEVTGAMIDFLPVEPDNRSLIAQMAHSSTRIVSLTITEGGYFLDPATAAFDPTHPDIQHDLQNPTKPRTAFGAIVAALAQRRHAGTGPFTVQSCDNLQGNGDITRSVVCGVARQADPALAAWIEATCSFPNSMVDCIVPATGEAERAQARAMGVEDAVPVTHEYFRQWVLEDTFCAGRPNWDRVGATFTQRVHDYEAMKIRVLNAGHQVLANVGELLSVPTIAECMAHPLISGFYRKVTRNEIVPYIPSVPDMSPSNYAKLVEQRFANPAIQDTTRRVASDGSSRHPGFVLPIAHDAIAAGGSVEGLALTEALWARMCAGTREDGSVIDANDPNWTRLVTSAQAARTNPQAWLDQTGFYNGLGTAPTFADAFASWHQMIWQEGTRAALSAYTAD